MAKQVIWTDLAKLQKKDILLFWAEHNKSNTYSKKLNQLFNEAIAAVKQSPKIGRQIENDTASVKVVKDYLIVYEETATNIVILLIWDGRQNPERLEFLLQGY